MRFLRKEKIGAVVMACSHGRCSKDCAETPTKTRTRWLQQESYSTTRAVVCVRKRALDRILERCPASTKIFRWLLLRSESGPRMNADKRRSALICVHPRPNNFLNKNDRSIVNQSSVGLNVGRAVSRVKPLPVAREIICSRPVWNEDDVSI